ncbi:aldose 1-epimerase [Deinococcus sp.]|uniref:aldose 1-epimerase n=1 Tax=Deinococcus sp. TaxID=47478 RepID=UPI003B5AC03B
MSIATSPSVTVRNAYWKLDVLPEWGASILNLETASGRPVLRRVNLAHVRSSSDTAAFALMPYSNRIRDARFDFEGNRVQLRPAAGSPNVQHGDVRNRPWQIEQTSESALSCTFDSRDVADMNWPWPFTARLAYHLHGPHCDIALTLTNAGRELMPAGIGLHPYFQRCHDGLEPTLHFEAGGWYQTGAGSIPERGAQPIPPRLDFAQARELGPDTIDAVFSSWDGTAQLRWPGESGEGVGRSLTLTADNVFSHLVLFTAPDDSLALEPVSHATDAFNLAARGVHGTDMKVLSPGQSLAGAIRLTQGGAW